MDFKITDVNASRSFWNANLLQGTNIDRNLGFVTTGQKFIYDGQKWTYGSGGSGNVPEGDTFGQYLYWGSGISEWTVGGTTINIGNNAGRNSISFSTGSVFIGENTGRFSNTGNTGVDIIAIGKDACSSYDGRRIVSGITGSFICIGKEAGYTGGRGLSIAIGNRAGYSVQRESIAIGEYAGYTGQESSISIYNPYNNETIIEPQIRQQSSISIGNRCGTFNQTSSIAVGTFAGYTSQVASIAIGNRAGYTGQNRSIAIGDEAGYTNQGVGRINFTNEGSSIAIGKGSGYDSQGNSAIGIGFFSGRLNQSTGAIAMGFASAAQNQGNNAIAIGFEAGCTFQGTGSIAIGYRAGFTGQKNNSIVLNASGTALNPTNSTLYIAPITGSTRSTNHLVYDSDTCEISYSQVSAYVSGTTGSTLFYTDSGGSQSTGINLDYTKIGKLCLLKVPNVLLNGLVDSDISISITGAIGSDSSFCGSIPTVNNNLYTNGSYYFENNELRFSPDADPDNTFSGTGGWEYPLNITYTTV